MTYVHIKKDKQTGFSSHMENAIFVGYPPQYKGWEFYNPITNKFILSDHADFDERVFPGLKGHRFEGFLDAPQSDAVPSAPFVNLGGIDDDSDDLNSQNAPKTTPNQPETPLQSPQPTPSGSDSDSGFAVVAVAAAAAVAAVVVGVHPVLRLDSLS